VWFWGRQFLQEIYIC